MRKEDMMRDPDSNAIINKNSEIIRAAKLKKQKLREEQQRIESLENDVADIKDMLKQLLERAGS
jgi:hypothetical protein